MAMTTDLMTWAEFEQLPDDAMHREIIRGELITLPPPMFGHSEIAGRAHEALRPPGESGIGKLFWGAGCKLSHDPPTWIQPDICFLWAEDIRATLPDDYFTAAPGLAVEVVCAAESARDLERKVETLLAAGGHKSGWCIRILAASTSSCEMAHFASVVSVTRCRSLGVNSRLGGCSRISALHGCPDRTDC